MVDNGIRFVGHGLKKDFSMINLVVPPEHIIDTVDLFSLPHQRKLSLRFLCAHLLHLDIQSVTHDSIEDARSALALYHLYCKITQQPPTTAASPSSSSSQTTSLSSTAQQALTNLLQRLYEIGQQTNFQIPDSRGTVVDSSAYFRSFSPAVSRTPSPALPEGNLGTVVYPSSSAHLRPPPP